MFKKNMTVIAICSKFVKPKYLPHYASYELEKADENLSLIDLKIVKGTPINEYYLQSGKKVIRLKKYL